MPILSMFYGIVVREPLKWETPMHPHVRAVRPLDDYRMEVLFGNNGERRMFFMKPFLKRGIFVKPYLSRKQGGMSRMVMASVKPRRGRVRLGRAGRGRRGGQGGRRIV